MTVLEQYQRLECTGLWRSDQASQRQEVIVALGEASLVLSDKTGQPLTHWSLPAIERLNPGQAPALYRAGTDSDENLELEDDLMIAGIEQVRGTIARSQNHPGRLRKAVIASTIVLLIGLLVFWLPDAMLRYTASVVPEASRQDIGRNVLTHIHRVTGGVCTSPTGVTSLDRLASRLGLSPGAEIVVLRDSRRMTAHLPGNIFLINRVLVEDYDTPAVLAAYVVRESLARQMEDPLLAALRQSGLRSGFQLLTTGKLRNEAAQTYGEHLLSLASKDIPDAQLLAALAVAQVPATPYAQALDVTLASTRGLIEGDPYPEGGASQILRDAEWVALQGICEAG